jgi:hypothetical protein
MQRILLIQFDVVEEAIASTKVASLVISHYLGVGGEELLIQNS